MVAKSIRTLTCDRCGRTQTIDPPGVEYSWARIEAAEVNGAKGVPKHSDMCPPCAAEFFKWWKGG